VIPETVVPGSTGGERRRPSPSPSTPERLWDPEGPIGGGIAAPIAQANAVAGSAIIQAPATYRTSSGTYVVFRGSSSMVGTFRIIASNPPTIASGWSVSQSGRGSPFVTTTDGTNNGFWSDTHDFRTPDSPQAPSPSPSPAPGTGSGGQNGHIGAGPLTEDRARLATTGTFNEFPNLHAVFGSEGAAVGAADQLLRRTIWHLKLAGFEAARQKNPSGAISSDKMCVKIGGVWRVFDIYSLGVAGRATTVHWLEITGANPQAHAGIPD